MNYDKEKYIDSIIKRKQAILNDAIQNGIRKSNNRSEWIEHKGKSILMVDRFKSSGSGSVYNGETPPWEFSTFIECIEWQNK